MVKYKKMTYDGSEVQVQSAIRDGNGAKIDTTYVPKTRTVNNKALSSDITLSASDVSALPSNTAVDKVKQVPWTTNQDGQEARILIKSGANSDTQVTDYAYFVPEVTINGKTKVITAPGGFKGTQVGGTTKTYTTGANTNRVILARVNNYTGLASCRIKLEVGPDTTSGAKVVYIDAVWAGRGHALTIESVYDWNNAIRYFFCVVPNSTSYYTSSPPEIHIQQNSAVARTIKATIIESSGDVVLMDNLTTTGNTTNRNTRTYDVNTTIGIYDNCGYVQNSGWSGGAWDRLDNDRYVYGENCVNLSIVARASDGKLWKLSRTDKEFLLPLDIGSCTGTFNAGANWGRVARTIRGLAWANFTNTTAQTTAFVVQTLTTADYGKTVYLVGALSNNGNFVSGRTVVLSMATPSSGSLTYIPIGKIDRSDQNISTTVPSMWTLDTYNANAYTINSNGKLTHINGKQIYDSGNTWTAMVGATSSANGSVGYVNATPPKDGYNTKYLRADGTWQVPPDTWTALAKGTSSAAGTAGYAPAPPANTQGGTSFLSSAATWVAQSSITAGAATKLAATKNINGTAFDGSADITISDYEGANTQATNSINGSANFTLKLPATIKASITGNCSGSSGSCTGNAATATSAGKLQNTSKIGDTNKPVYFKADGTPDPISYTIDKSVPSTAVFTDTNVRQTLQTGNYKLPLLMSYQVNTSTSSNVDNICYRNNSIWANPSLGGINATQIGGVSQTYELQATGYKIALQMNKDTFWTTNSGQAYAHLIVEYSRVSFGSLATLDVRKGIWDVTAKFSGNDYSIVAVPSGDQVGTGDGTLRYFRIYSPKNANYGPQIGFALENANIKVYIRVTLLAGTPGWTVLSTLGSDPGTSNYNVWTPELGRYNQWFTNLKMAANITGSCDGTAGSAWDSLKHDRLQAGSTIPTGLSYPCPTGHIIGTADDGCAYSLVANAGTKAFKLPFCGGYSPENSNVNDTTVVNWKNSRGADFKDCFITKMGFQVKKYVTDTYKGTKTTYANLPTSGNAIGDIWQISGTSGADNRLYHNPYAHTWWYPTENNDTPPTGSYIVRPTPYVRWNGSRWDLLPETGDSLYIVGSLDANGNFKVDSSKILVTDVSAGYTFLKVGEMDSYHDTSSISRRFTIKLLDSKAYTLNSNGKLTHIDGKEIYNPVIHETYGSNILTLVSKTDTTYSGYPYMYAMSLNASSSLTPHVRFSPADAGSGIFAPECTLISDQLLIYTKTALNSMETVGNTTTWSFEYTLFENTVL